MRTLKYVGHVVDGHVGYVFVADLDRTITAIREDDSTKQLDLRLDLVNHSPTGFSWGYQGSGPAQAALAILADYLEDDKRALSIYQDFKQQVIARLPMGKDFELDWKTIEDAITKAEVRRMQWWS